MYKLWQLIRVQFVNSFQLFDGKEKIKPLHIGLAILVVISMTPSLFGIGYLVYEALLMLIPLQQEGVVLSLWIVGLSTMIFFLALFIIPAIFYFSKDIERLLVLPIDARAILLSKFALVYAYEFITITFFSIPVLIPVILILQPGLSFYVMTFIIFITLSIVPLSLAAILVLLVMSLFPKFKNRDLFNLLSSFIILGFALGLSLLMNQPATMEAEALIALLIDGNNSLISLIQTFIISVGFAVNALVYLSWLDLLIYLVLTGAFLMLFIFIGQLLYFKGVIGVSETSSKRHLLSQSHYQKATQRTPVIKAYWLKEMRLLLRTPIYLFNNVSPAILMPLLIVPILFTQSNSSDELVLMIQSMNWSDPNIFMWVIFAGLCVGILMSALNLITPTALSREGAQFEFMKRIPVSYLDQIMAKILSAYAISLLAIIIFIVPLSILLQWSLFLTVLAFIAAVLGSTLINNCGMIIDLIRPKLIWENEAVPVKQNMNAMFALLLAVVLVALFFTIPYFLPANLLSALLLFIALIALNLGVLQILYSSTATLMQQIEI